MKPFVKILVDTLPISKLDILDSKKVLMSSLPYYLFFIVTLLAIKYIETNAWIITAILYIVLPILDEIFTLDQLNPT